MPKAMPIQDLISQSQRLRGADRLAEAERVCRQTLVQVASNASALFESAAIAFSSDRVAIAADRFKRVKTVLPATSAVYFNMAICDQRLSNEQEVGDHLRRALILDPKSSGAMAALARNQLALQANDTAMVTAERNLILEPVSNRSLAAFGFVAWRAKQWSAAEKALRAALVLNPERWDADLNLANVFVETRRSLEAVRRYRRLALFAPRDESIWGNLGVTLIDLDDWRGASEAYSRLVRLSRGRPTNHEPKDPYPELPVEPKKPMPRTTAWHRLKFDLEQLVYLLNQRLLPKTFEKEVEAYTQIIEGLNENQRSAISFELPEKDADRISRYNGRLVHIANTGWGSRAPASDTHPRPETSALDPKVDWDDAATAFLGSNPPITVVDNFLHPTALTALRKFCLESTIWFELKGAGYLGAYFRDGFNDPLLLAIAEELTAQMPEVFKGYPLRTIWAYTYEQSMVGINPHADFARINVNFWITPDSANLDPETGGLLIYRRPAPSSWGFEQYNAAPGAEVMKFLGDDADRPIRIPHRQNRAVIFDSRLFHETDRLYFREGLKNRRINVTMLFGRQ
jgi:tetratricopeptide (TPR) repeat protein